MPTFSCAECSNVTNSEKLLRAHICVAHLDDWRPFACDYCPVSTPTAEEMRAHLLADHELATGDYTCRADKQRQAKLELLLALSLHHSVEQQSDDEDGEGAQSGVVDEAHTVDQSLAERLADQSEEGAESNERRIAATENANDTSADLNRHDSAPAGAELERRRTSVSGQRRPTRRMLQRDGSFCVECRSLVVNGRSSRHIYQHHLSGDAFVCRLCSRGFCEACDVRTHFARSHAGEAVSFDDLRDELEQQFLQAYLRCYAPLPGTQVEDARAPPERTRKRKTSEHGDTVETRVAAKRCIDDSSRTVSPIIEAREEMKPDVYEFDEAIPKHESTWQTRQRDHSYCQLCDSALPKSHLHIQSVHLSRKPFACSICGYRASEAGLVKGHAKNVHQGERVQLLDYRAGLRPEYEEWIAKCFRSRSDIKADSAHTRLPNRNTECVISSATTISTHQMSSDNHRADFPSLVVCTTPNAPARGEIENIDSGGGRLKLTWKMLQRDCSSCVVCNAPVKHGARSHIFDEHIKSRPFSCSICSKGFKINSIGQTHLKTVHRGETGHLADNRIELEPLYEQWHARCFRRKHESTANAVVGCESAIVKEELSVSSGLSAEENSTDLSTGAVRLQPTREMLQRDASYCILCDATVNTSHSTARFHIYNVHMREPPFVCSVCGKGFKVHCYGRTHFKKVHNGEEGCVLDNREKLEPDYELWHERCFALKKEFIQ